MLGSIFRFSWNRPERLSGTSGIRTDLEIDNYAYLTETYLSGQIG